MKKNFLFVFALVFCVLVSVGCTKSASAPVDKSAAVTNVKTGSTSTSNSATNASQTNTSQQPGSGGCHRSQSNGNG